MSYIKEINADELRTKVRLLRIEVNEFFRVNNKSLAEIRQKVSTYGTNKLLHCDATRRWCLHNLLSELLEKTHEIQVDLDLIEMTSTEYRPLWEAREENFETFHQLLHAKWFSVVLRNTSDMNLGFYIAQWKPHSTSAKIITHKETTGHANNGEENTTM
jgi:hypothetical protein